MKACQDMEREKMMEGLAKRFSSGVKREGAVVHFEEEDVEDINEQKDREYVQIRLEGGVAFGTGEHPTTRLCLDWVRDNVERQLHLLGADEGPKSLNIMDYGSGSGVLGIAAAAVIRDHITKSKRSGQPSNIAATVVGLEIDADAIHIANDNSQKNNVEMKNYLPDPDSLDDEAISVVLRAMQRKRNKDIIQYIPSELNGPIYDLLVANILAGPLVNLASTVASLVKSGGEIGLSGILATQGDCVVTAYEEFFDDVQVAAEEGGWVLVTGRRR
jgi:ribosomal protein L11 methyltransferase